MIGNDHDKYVTVGMQQDKIRKEYLAKNRMKELQKVSDQKYTGWVTLWSYKGEEFWVDAEDKEEMERLGAKREPIFLG